NIHQDSASAAEDPTSPNFTIQVNSKSTTAFKEAEQDFVMHFTANITITNTSHKFKLSKIRLGGGNSQLVENQRYYFKNFNVKVSPVRAEIRCEKVKPGRDDEK